MVEQVGRGLCSFFIPSSNCHTKGDREKESYLCDKPDAKFTEDALMIIIRNKVVHVCNYFSLGIQMIFTPIFNICLHHLMISKRVTLKSLMGRSPSHLCSIVPCHATRVLISQYSAPSVELS